MDMQAITADIRSIRSLPRIWALIETIDRETARTEHNDLIPEENNPRWEELVQIGALLSCQRETLENGYFARNGVMPYHTADYASFKNECDNAAMWYGWPIIGENMTIGADAAIYDEEGNEDISDMLPGIAANPIYS